MSTKRIVNGAKQYSDAVTDLNKLQSTSQAVIRARYNDPHKKLAEFRNQMELAGIDICDLDKLNVIHIAGTKGKGSTCVFIDNILRRNGLRTGFYNSPHLISVNERIQIDGEPLNHEKFARYFYEIYERFLDVSIDAKPTYFSFLTILAFHVFMKEEVDCAIIEVGIGGEFDPTNVIEQPVACAITTLDYDHTNLLGNTIEDIARTKAGICKPKVPIFTIDQTYGSTMKVIHDRAKASQSPLAICSPLKNLNQEQLGIDGAAQIHNATLACNLSRYYLWKRDHSLLPYELMNQNVSNLECDLNELPDSFKVGLRESQWSGRCQKLSINENFHFYLDGAHTPESMKNCLRWFVERSQNPSVHVCKILLINIIGDRNKEEILNPLIKYPWFRYVIFSTNTIGVNFDKNQGQDDIKPTEKRDQMIRNMEVNLMVWRNLNQILSSDKETRCETISTIYKSLEFLVDLAKQDSLKIEVLVTGSLHFVGNVLKCIQLHEGLSQTSG